MSAGPDDGGDGLAAVDCESITARGSAIASRGLEDVRLLESKGGQMGYALNELSAKMLKEVFDAAFMESRVDGGRLRVRDEEVGIWVTVTPEPEKDVLHLHTLFGVDQNHGYQQVLSFCNRFNNGMIMCCARCDEEPDSDGDWLVALEHDRIMFSEERIEPKSIVLLVRKFIGVATAGIARLDTDDLF